VFFIKFFTGILQIVTGLLLLLLGYTSWFRSIFEKLGYPTEDIYAARFMGFVFILFGLAYILYKAFRKNRR
jgi:hypothetical protein